MKQGKTRISTQHEELWETIISTGTLNEIGHFTLIFTVLGILSDTLRGPEKGDGIDCTFLSARPQRKTVLRTHSYSVSFLGWLSATVCQTHCRN